MLKRDRHEIRVIAMLTVTAAILIRNDRIFIGQRKAGKQMADLWEFPGGKLEHGETPQECLAREMKEEFGVEVAVGEFFGESVYEYEHGAIRLLAYVVDWKSGDLTPSDHQDCRWVCIRRSGRTMSLFRLTDLSFGSCDGLVSAFEPKNAKMTKTAA